MTECASENEVSVTKSTPRQSLRFVLVETSHPGNIGAAALALKTMGFDELALVSPRRFPSAEATARASGADDILQQTRVFDSLADAVADCSVVYGTSARSRSIEWPTLNPWELAEQVHARSLQAAAGSADTVAVVFGRESSGLRNDELMLCTGRVHIPANPAYSSLNVASAVQILAYELATVAQRSPSAPVETAAESEIEPLADQADMGRFYSHLESVLTRIGYYDPDKPRQLMRRLRRLFNRATLSRSELQILRGVLVAVERHGKD